MKKRKNGMGVICRVCGGSGAKKGICKSCDAMRAMAARGGPRNRKGPRIHLWKPCPRCGSKEKRLRGGKSGGCLSCSRTYAQARNARLRKENPEAVNRAAKEWRERNPLRAKNTELKSRFGITLEQYNEKLLAQGGACAICRGHNPSGKMLAVDHDHRSGKLRDLLCGRCNSALGHLRDEPGLCRLAAEYLERWRDE